MADGYDTGASSKQSGAEPPIDNFTRDQCVHVCAGLPLFAGLSRRDLRSVVAIAIQRAYPAGAVLVGEGRRPEGLFVVLRGRVRVLEDAAEAREPESLGPAGMFAEMALLEDVRPCLSVIAVEPTQALIIPVGAFHAALRENAVGAIRLVIALSRLGPYARMPPTD